MTPDRSTGEWSLAVRQQAAVARLGQLGLRGIPLDELLGEAMTAVGETLEVPHASLFELLPGRTELRGRTAVYNGQPVPPEMIAKIRIPAGLESMPGFTVLEGAAVSTPDLLDDARFNAQAPRWGIDARSAITAPIGWDDEAWGVLAIYSDTRRVWTDDEVHFAQSVANTVGLAIQRQRIEHELRDSSVRLELSLDAGGLGSWLWDIEADTVTLSAAALEIYGLGPDEFDGTGDHFLSFVHPDDQVELRGGVFEAMQTSGEQHQVFRIIRGGDGAVRWVESWGRLLTERGFPQRLVGVSADVTERRLTEQGMETLLLREQGAREEAELARERFTILAEASGRLSQSLDPAVTLSSLADFCVPALADVCLVDTFDEQGDLGEVAGAAIDDDTLALARLLRVRRDEIGTRGGVWTERNLAVEASPTVHAEITDEQLVAGAVDAEHLAAYRRFGARSSVEAPLVARGRVIGLLTLVATTPRSAYGPDLVSLIEELALRAALALDNALLFASRNRVARSLQDALLPPALPSLPGVQLAARYRVAEADTEIGGDFYDVMQVGTSAWGVVVGDVCGRGPAAAALTGLVRHSVRTAVVNESAPSRVLAQTNDAVLDQIDDARFCTAAYLRVELPDDPGSAVWVVASSAGHPRPAVLRADGSAELIDCAGLLLGVVPSPRLTDVHLVLEPGDAVVLYTDGVTEARQGKELFGEDRLVEALAGLAGGSAEEIAAGLDDAVSRFQDDANDDIAILVLRVS